ncbi:Gfo/Idh/MocA family protein [Allobaculum stercoricanis]|uniref:Gfo/Idh/MocA family protein n=1 Tax=Allobaculum stercoricanis TaxID=174709 RepID=UPI00248D6492|nr:Gfo/Idh/MocA family oxidoreductase [Allobaculum stercoricanis]
MKLATIGSGSIVDLAYQSFAEIENIETVAVYSRTMEKAKAFAQKHNVECAYDDLDQMFADPNIDTIYIASPNSLHYPQAKKALLAKKNVILEKPFTPNLEQTEELFQIAQENGVMIFEAITNVHTANYKLLKEHLNKAGKVRQCLFNFSQYSRRYAKYMEHTVENVFDPKMDGGALLDINIYNIHLAVGLFGQPKEIHYYPLLGWNGIDTSGTLMLLYEDKNITCIGSKDSSSDYLGYIQGESGTFKISNGSTGRMQDVEFIPPLQENQTSNVEQISIDQGLHMSYEFKDFADAIDQHNEEMYQSCKEHSLKVAKILEVAKQQRNALAKEKGFEL